MGYLDGEVALTDVLRLPAYQAVFSHARKFSEGLKQEDVERAVLGEETGYYGMTDVQSNRQSMADLLWLIRDRHVSWLSEIHTAIRRIFPEADLSKITICPIVGYDAGIGHDSHVCMNVNWGPYHVKPDEFLYTAIHEVFHTVYEQMHELPDFREINTREARLDFFYTMMQNEGGAVYAPLSLRERNSDMGSNLHRIFEDYLVLQDKNRMHTHVDRFLEVEHYLQCATDMAQDEYASLVFSPERLTYRVGCKLLQLIETACGLAAVRDALQMPGREFVERYRHLLA